MLFSWTLVGGQNQVKNQKLSYVDSWWQIATLHG